MTMTLVHYYPDAYLGPLITDAREAQATSDVADLGTLPASWVARLVVLRAYVIACLESQRAPDDTFAAKLSAYRKEYEVVLSQARAAQASIEAAASTAGAGSIFTVELFRS
jgi:hypothetical protein